MFVVGWLWKLLSRRMGGAGIVLWVMIYAWLMRPWRRDTVVG